MQEEYFYTVMIKNGHIHTVKHVSEDAIMAGDNGPLMMEEVTDIFQNIIWTYEIGCAMHTDQWWED